VSKRSKRQARKQTHALAQIAPQPSHGQASTVQVPQQTGIPRQAGLIVAQSSSFSGPLPPPDILQHYEDVVPGAADRIFKMAENQANHRQDLEGRVIRSDILKSYFGLAAGFAVAVVAIVGGVIVATGGQGTAGAAIGGAPVAALVVAFLSGTSSRRSERESKSQQMQQSQSRRGAKS
jgi:uncharacterized membrane protein